MMLNNVLVEHGTGKGLIRNIPFWVLFFFLRQSFSHNSSLTIPC